MLSDCSPIPSKLFVEVIATEYLALDSDFNSQWWFCTFGGLVHFSKQVVVLHQPLNL